MGSRARNSDGKFTADFKYPPPPRPNVPLGLMEQQSNLRGAHPPPSLVEGPAAKGEYIPTPGVSAHPGPVNMAPITQQTFPRKLPHLGPGSNVRLELGDYIQDPITGKMERIEY